MKMATSRSPSAFFGKKTSKELNNIGAVVVGFDPHLSSYKMQYAQALLNRNYPQCDDSSKASCRFVATNLDSTAPSSYKTEDGMRGHLFTVGAG